MSAEPQRFDPERILAVLDLHRVDYIMVGGFASQLHGARRQTYDIRPLIARLGSKTC